MKMMTPFYYHVDVSWNKDRQGVMCSPELQARLSENGCIEVATPPEFLEDMHGIWSPEHLYTASVASCFMTTFLAVAENFKLEFSSFLCRAIGKLDYLDGRLAMTEVTVQPEVSIKKLSQENLTIRVMEKAEKACLISNSIKTSVIMTPPVVRIADLAEQEL